MYECIIRELLVQVNNSTAFWATCRHSLPPRAVGFTAFWDPCHHPHAVMCPADRPGWSHARTACRAARRWSRWWATRKSRWKTPWPSWRACRAPVAPAGWRVSGPLGALGAITGQWRNCRMVILLLQLYIPPILTVRVHVHGCIVSAYRQCM